MENMHTERSLLSEDSEDEPEKKPKKESEAVVEPEKDLGKVTLRDYYNMMRYSAGIFGIFLYFLLSSASAVGQLAPTYWLTIWTNQSVEEQKRNLYPNVFVITIAIFFVLAFLRSISIQGFMLISATNMHA